MNDAQILAPNQLLPADMQRLEHITDWTPDLRSAVLAGLLAGDPLAVRDFLESLAHWPVPGRKPPLGQVVDRLAARYSPCDVYSMWATCSQWATAVQKADLTDVIGSQTAWNPDLVLEASYWLQEHATLRQARYLAEAADHPEVIGPSRLGRELDQERLTYALAELVTPQELGDAWQQLTGPTQLSSAPPARHRRRGHTRRSLTKQEVTDLGNLSASLSRSGPRRRWHNEPGQRLIDKLARYRHEGVTLGELAKAVSISPAQIYQLTADAVRRAS